MHALRSGGPTERAARNTLVDCCPPEPLSRRLVPRRQVAGGSHRRSTRRFAARDILGMRPGVDTAPCRLRANPRYDEAAPTLSPDGRGSPMNPTKRADRGLRPPLSEHRRRQVAGLRRRGQAPLWAHSGKELFYLDGARNMVVVPVMPGAPFPRPSQPLPPRRTSTSAPRSTTRLRHHPRRPALHHGAYGSLG